MQDAPAGNLPRRVAALLGGILALAAAGGRDGLAQSPPQRTFVFPQLSPFHGPQFAAEDAADDFRLTRPADRPPPPATNGSTLGTVAPLGGGKPGAVSGAYSASGYSVLPTPPGENLGTVGGSGERPDTTAGREDFYRPDMPPQKRKISTYFADGLT
ncbi:MAG TPA: hypothetical protein PK867_14415, partial [Pirellulales bacterium]|nr:hypothetical protein [Pirellulales bacterium]